ncbi:MAG: O-antigen ligase family protein [Candidatus Saccharibacteria bacterium]|nr:O-antigen ligase family protein [Candidatus Saccharibacteria bacterium]
MKAKSHLSASLNVFLQYVTSVCLILGLFYWETNLYQAFWFRRFFAIFAGVLSLASIMSFRRELLVVLAKRKALMLFMGISSVSLIFQSSLWQAFFGYPLVHPALASMFSSVCIGLWLTTLDRVSILKTAYYATLAWSSICFIYWLQDDISLRLGFVHSQVIYAACLFALGGMLALWHFNNKTLPRIFVVSSGLFLFACLLLSQTRSALLLLIVYILFSNRQSILTHKKVSLLLAGLAVMSVALSGLYFSRLYNTGYLTRSVEYRMNLAQASFPSNDSQLLFGGGMGSIENNIHDNAPKYVLLEGDIKDGIKFESSHNYLVDIVVERGLLAALLFVFIVYQAIFAGLRLQSPADRIIFDVYVFLLLFLFFNNINIQMEILLWSCMVLLLCGGHQTKTRLQNT